MYAMKNDLKENTRKNITTLLQARLSEAIDITLQAKQAHWNVKGTNFIALHELFDTVHSEFDDYADLIAERIMALGGQSFGTARFVADNSSLPEYPLTAVKQADHIDALATAMAAFAAATRQAISESSALGDEITADIFTEITRAVDKSIWLVQSNNL